MIQLEQGFSGLFEWRNDPRKVARRAACGDERAIVDLYLDGRDPLDASAGSEAERMFRVVGLVKVEEMVATRKAWAKTLTPAQAAEWREEDCALRIRRLEAVLRNVRAFAKKEGLKFRRTPRLRVVAGRGAVRRAA